MPDSWSSVLQVHLATYKGETVVVKVQSPGLKQLFDIDLKNVQMLPSVVCLTAGHV